MSEARIFVAHIPRIQGISAKRAHRRVLRAPSCTVPSLIASSNGCPPVGPSNWTSSNELWVVCTYCCRRLWASVELEVKKRDCEAHAVRWVICPLITKSLRGPRGAVEFGLHDLGARGDHALISNMHVLSHGGRGSGCARGHL